MMSKTLALAIGLLPALAFAQSAAILVNNTGNLPRFLYYMSCRNVLNPVC
jgi:ABC-type uncharacterized transport system YnjBCD permease subunit